MLECSYSRSSKDQMTISSDLLGVGAELEDVAWLAVEGAADGVEGRETHGLGFAGFQDGEIGDSDAHALAQFIERNLATRHHHV